MDKYYSDLARTALSAAQEKIVLTQNYLAKAQADPYLHDSAKKLLDATRNLQDLILLHTQKEEAESELAEVHFWKETLGRMRVRCDY